MTYVPQTWADGLAGATPVNAARLNHMEAGIAAAYSSLDAYIGVQDSTGFNSQPTLMDPSSTQFDDGAWWQFDYSNAGFSRMRVGFGGHFLELTGEDNGTYSLTAADATVAASGSSATASMSAFVNDDGTGADGYTQVSSSAGGFAYMEASDVYAGLAAQANPGQTDALLDLQGSDGNSLFTVKPTSFNGVAAETVVAGSLAGAGNYAYDFGDAREGDLSAFATADDGSSASVSVQAYVSADGSQVRPTISLRCTDATSAQLSRVDIDSREDFADVVVYGAAGQTGPLLDLRDSGDESILSVKATPWTGDPNTPPFWQTNKLTLRPKKGKKQLERFVVTGSPTGGSFTLDFYGGTTGSIAYNADQAAVQAAFDAIIPGVFVVAGGTPDFTIEQNQRNVVNYTSSLNTNSLTGGTSPSVALSVPVVGFQDQTVPVFALTDWDDNDYLTMGLFSIGIWNADYTAEVNLVSNSYQAGLYIQTKPEQAGAAIQIVDSNYEDRLTFTSEEDTATLLMSTGGDGSFGVQFSAAVATAAVYGQSGQTATVFGAGNGTTGNFCIEATGDDRIGFYNHAPVSKPTGVAVSAAGIHAALVSLGLISA